MFSNSKSILLIQFMLIALFAYQIQNHKDLLRQFTETREQIKLVYEEIRIVTKNIDSLHGNKESENKSEEPHDH